MFMSVLFTIAKAMKPYKDLKKKKKRKWLNELLYNDLIEYFVAI